MNLFDAQETVENSKKMVDLLESLLASRKEVLLLQEDLKSLLEAAAQFDPVDPEHQRLNEQVEEVSFRLVELVGKTSANGAVTVGDLLVVAVNAAPSAKLETLVSVHCGTPQWGSHVSVGKDGNFLVC